MLQSNNKQSQHATRSYQGYQQQHTSTHHIHFPNISQAQYKNTPISYQSALKSGGVLSSPYKPDTSKDQHASSHISSSYGQKIYEVKKKTDGQMPNINGRPLTTQFSSPYEVKENGQNFVYRTRIVPMDELQKKQGVTSSGGIVGGVIKSEVNKTQTITSGNVTKTYQANTQVKTKSRVQLEKSTAKQNSRTLIGNSAGHGIPMSSPPAYPSPQVAYQRSTAQQSPSNSQIKYEQFNPASSSRIRYQQQITSNTSGSHIRQEQPPPVSQNVIFSHQSISPSVPQGPINFMNDQQKSGSRISNVSTETVPRIQYERCVNQCKNWQTKYNELYLKFMNAVSSQQQYSYASHEQQRQQRQIQELRRQNNQLRGQLKQNNAKNRKMLQIVESNFDQMVKKQRDATLKEAVLLMERFKLETKKSHR